VIREFIRLLDKIFPSISFARLNALPSIVTPVVRNTAHTNSVTKDRVIPTPNSNVNLRVTQVRLVLPINGLLRLPRKSNLLKTAVKLGH
jgi:hypothetical protein